MQAEREVVMQSQSCDMRLDHDRLTSYHNDIVSNPLARLTYRSIELRDKEQLKSLHEEFFPVRYSPTFFDDMSLGKGIHGGNLFSILAVDSENTSVIQGFILAQFVAYPTDSEDHQLFSAATGDPDYVLYILTLGVRHEYRRHGLASQLLRLCKEHALTNPACGAIYLHVISYNTGAMQLYSKSHFVRLRQINNFYHIENKYFSAELYIYYIHGFAPPIVTTLIQSITRWTRRGWSMINTLFTSVIPISWFRVLQPLHSLNTSSINHDPNTTASNGNNNTAVEYTNVGRNVEKEDFLQV